MVDKRIEVLKYISKDMEEDINAFEGAPFNGRNVSIFNGKQNAAIAALADIVRSILEED